MSQAPAPSGYLACGWNAGIKDHSLDFGCIHSSRPASAAAVFTRSHFPGNPVIVGREHIQDGKLQTIVVNSKNANVATGQAGLDLARNMCKWTGEALNVDPAMILPSSTGVIGRLPPADRLEAACRSLPDKLHSPDFNSFSRAIMTTDAFPKVRGYELHSGIAVLGMAKGAGMIEPNMATMLSYIVTDATMEAADLNRLLKFCVNRSFNRISVDSDTSTSDTVVIMANGAAGKPAFKFPVGLESLWSEQTLETILGDPLPQTGEKPDQVERSNPWPDHIGDEELEFVRAVLRTCIYLSREIVRDGEGASRFFEVLVVGARSQEAAYKVGRSLINSPLVKTAIHGSDPNWGRIIMAIGKVFDEAIRPDHVKIYAGDQLLFQGAGKDVHPDLEDLKAHFQQPEVKIKVDLDMGTRFERFWASDLTSDYVRLNADYTT
ncbi:MAG: ornithine acetyltransferase [Spirochaetaceae bacterium]|nr:ornithine acetyltransferase [Spirochaetaceae bacterium]|tara:strand:- start:85603 stop:86907 length:1305 start_codon:yes stop_codon:yes gene_type:complete